MVAGHLREKSGYYYAVLNYTDSLGKRKTKWISTGLTVKGNKKRAEAILMDARRNFNPEEPLFHIVREQNVSVHDLRLFGIEIASCVH